MHPASMFHVCAFGLDHEGVRDHQVRGRKGRCHVLSSAAGRFPLECASSFAVLERELNNDEEEFFSAKSDDEQTATAINEEETCSTGGVLGVPKQRLDATRVAHHDSREKSLETLQSPAPTTKGATPWEHTGWNYV
eukprot:4986681-Amphidinium_carterae.1